MSTRGTSTRQGRRGFSLLELLIALTLFTMSTGAAVYALARGAALGRLARERALALEAAESVLEAIQGEQFREAFQRFNATAADDPPAGASPGAAFDVRGLEARPDDADGLPGEIVFPGGGVVLREDAVDRELGLPRDLNADDVVDALDHGADYRLLPVRVRVRWRGASGNQALELVALISNDRNVPAGGP